MVAFCGMTTMKVSGPLLMGTMGGSQLAGSE